MCFSKHFDVYQTKLPVHEVEVNKQAPLSGGTNDVPDNNGPRTSDIREYGFQTCTELAILTLWSIADIIAVYQGLKPSRPNRAGHSEGSS
jgi:hypothetical protein